MSEWPFLPPTDTNRSPVFQRQLPTMLVASASCACMCVLVYHADFSKTTTVRDFLSIVPMKFHALENFFDFVDLSLKVSE